MQELQNISVIDSIYEASSSGSDWSAVGSELCERLGAHSGSLRLNSGGASTNVFKPTETEETLYAERYQFIDPVRSAARRLSPGSDWRRAVTTSDDLIPTELYQRSEFYQEFARPNGQNHMLLGAIGGDARTVVGFFREQCPFDDADRHALVQLLPHLQRAVQLHERLTGLDRDARLGANAFEALAGAAVVVDGNLDVLFTNSTAGALLADKGSPFLMTSERSPFGPLVQHLSLRDRTCGARLRALVKDAATGGAGGALRVEADDGLDLPSRFAVVVSPQPSTHPASHAGRTCQVLVLIREIARRSTPPASLLGDLFGLSAAEQAVAVALLGGQTAEHVASERSVSLDTVRSQIRTLLRKSEAANLRDFERMGAMLSTLTRPTQAFRTAA